MLRDQQNPYEEHHNIESMDSDTDHIVASLNLEEILITTILETI